MKPLNEEDKQYLDHEFNDLNAVEIPVQEFIDKKINIAEIELPYRLKNELYKFILSVGSSIYAWYDEEANEVCGGILLKDVSKDEFNRLQRNFIDVEMCHMERFFKIKFV